MAEQRSPEEWADYYRARVAFMREQVRQGVPLNDTEGRQTILAFAQQWQDSHRTEEDPWSLTALQAKMEALTDGQQAETQTLKPHRRMGY